MNRAGDVQSFAELLQGVVSFPAEGSVVFVEEDGIDRQLFSKSFNRVGGIAVQDQKLSSALPDLFG